MDLSNVTIFDCILTGRSIDGIPVADLFAEWKKTRGRE
jgi:hypothetical protein